MERWVPIGQEIFKSGSLYDVQCQLDSANQLTIFIQDYDSMQPIYKIEFGTIVSYELIDEHLSYPPFLKKDIDSCGIKITNEILFEIISSDDELDPVFTEDKESLHRYFVRSDFYIEVLCYNEPKINILNIHLDRR